MTIPTVGAIHELPLQKDLPAGWVTVSLTDIADINPKLDKSDIPENLMVAFVPMQTVGAGDGRIDTNLNKPFAEVKKGYTPFQSGDVLFAKITPCMENGKIAVVPTLHNKLGFSSTEFHVIRPKDVVDPRYIYYYISRLDYRKEAASKMKGAVGQKRVPSDFIKVSAIPLAPLAQQKLIVAEIEKHFSRLDESVTNLKRVKANLKRYKAAVLKAAVEGKLTEEWRKQHPDVDPASELLKRILAERKKKWEEKNPRKKYKEPATPDTSNLPELPKGWVWARMDGIAALKGGITVDKNRKDPTARLVPYLRVANVQRGFIDLHEVKEIEAPAADIEELRLLTGDILFNEGGDRDKLGRGWIWEAQLPECIHQNHVFRARLFVNEMSSRFISWWGNSFGKLYFLREGKQTTNLASINLTKLSEFPVPIPALHEQQIITAEVEKLLSIAEEIEIAIEANLKRAERLRQAILKKAFSGKLI